MRDAHSKLIVGSGGAENGEGADDRHLAGRRHPGRDADDILLGRPEVEESVRVRGSEQIREGGLVEVAAQDHQVRVVSAQLHQRASRDFAG